MAVLGGCVVTGERISLWSDVRLVPPWPLLACGLAAARRPQTLPAVRLQTGLLALCPRNPCDGQGQAVTLAPCGAFSTLDSVLAAAPRRPRRGAWGSASPRLAAGQRPGLEAPSRTGAARPSALPPAPAANGSVSVLRGRADVSHRVAEGLLGDQSAWRWSLGGRSLSERRWHGHQVVLPDAPLLSMTRSSFPRGPAEHGVQRAGVTGAGAGALARLGRDEEALRRPASRLIGAGAARGRRSRVWGC